MAYYYLGDTVRLDVCLLTVKEKVYPYFAASDAVPGLTVRASLSSVQLCTVGLVEPARGTYIGWRVVCSMESGDLKEQFLMRRRESRFCLLYSMGHFAVLNCFPNSTSILPDILLLKLDPL